MKRSLRTVDKTAESGGHTLTGTSVQWLLVLLALVLLTGCSPLRIVNALSPASAERISENHSYGPDDRQKLDLYFPNQAKPEAPVIVFFYGGSWRHGHRASYQFVGHSLSARGYTVAIADYRLYPKVRFPEFVRDGAIALTWLKNNIPEAQNGFVLMGHSAGAHTAALLSLDTSYLSKHDLDIQEIHGMIGLAGPYAFNPLQYRRTRPVFSSLTTPEPAQPVNHACPGSDKPALLLLHGLADTIVYPKNSKTLHDKLSRCDGVAQHVEYPQVNHFDILIGLSDRFTYLAPVLADIETFLDDMTQKRSS